MKQTRSEYLREALHNRCDDKGLLIQTSVVVQYSGQMTAARKAIIAQRMAKSERMGMGIDEALRFVARHFSFSTCNHPAREGEVTLHDDGSIDYKAQGQGSFGNRAGEVLHIDLTH